MFHPIKSKSPQLKRVENKYMYGEFYKQGFKKFNEYQLAYIEDDWTNNAQDAAFNRYYKLVEQDEEQFDKIYKDFSNQIDSKFKFKGQNTKNSITNQKQQDFANMISEKNKNNSNNNIKEANQQSNISEKQSIQEKDSTNQNYSNMLQIYNESSSQEQHFNIINAKKLQNQLKEQKLQEQNLENQKKISVLQKNENEMNNRFKYLGKQPFKLSEKSPKLQTKNNVKLAKIQKSSTDEINEQQLKQDNQIPIYDADQFQKLDNYFQETDQNLMKIEQQFENEIIKKTNDNINNQLQSNLYDNSRGFQQLKKKQEELLPQSYTATQNNWKFSKNNNITQGTYATRPQTQQGGQQQFQRLGLNSRERPSTQQTNFLGTQQQFNVNKYYSKSPDTNTQKKRPQTQQTQQSLRTTNKHKHQENELQILKVFSHLIEEIECDQTFEQINFKVPFLCVKMMNQISNEPFVFQDAVKLSAQIVENYMFCMDNQIYQQLSEIFHLNYKSKRYLYRELIEVSTQEFKKQKQNFVIDEQKLKDQIQELQQTLFQQKNEHQKLIQEYENAEQKFLQKNEHEKISILQQLDKMEKEKKIYYTDLIEQKKQVAQLEQQFTLFQEKQQKENEKKLNQLRKENFDTDARQKELDLKHEMFKENVQELFENYKTSICTLQLNKDRILSLEAKVNELQAENDRLSKRAGTAFYDLTPRPSLDGFHEILVQKVKDDNKKQKKPIVTNFKNKVIDFKSQSTEQNINEIQQQLNEYIKSLREEIEQYKQKGSISQNTLLSIKGNTAAKKKKITNKKTGQQPKSKYGKNNTSRRDSLMSGENTIMGDEEDENDLSNLIDGSSQIIKEDEENEEEQMQNNNNLNVHSNQNSNTNIQNIQRKSSQKDNPLAFHNIIQKANQKKSLTIENKLDSQESFKPKKSLLNTKQ